MDKKYSKYLPLRDAAGSNPGISAKGAVDPSILVGGIKSAGGPGRAPLGTAHMQQHLNKGLDTVGREEPSAFTDFIRGVSTQAWSPKKLLDAGGRVVLGETKLQKQAQRLEPLAEVLRKYGVSGGTLGAAYED